MDEEYTERILQIAKSHQDGITLRELLKIIDVDVGLIQTELATLLKDGFLTCTTVGKEQLLEYHDPEDSKHLLSAAKDLPQPEFQIYKIVYSSKNKGIDRKEIQTKTGLATGQLTKILNQLKQKNWVKSVKGANSSGKGKNILIASGLELSESISGGIWYKDGVLNKELIEGLQNKVLSHMQHQPIMTEQQIVNLLRVNSLVDLEQRHVLSIVNLLIFDDKIEKIKVMHTNQLVNKYRLSNWDSSLGGAFNLPALTKIPCGKCPMIAECAPGGRISPENCLFFDEW